LYNGIINIDWGDYMIINTKIKKSIIVILILSIVILIGFIYFGELGINQEAPKKARYVNNSLTR
jgi:hypothetical protein